MAGRRARRWTAGVVALALAMWIPSEHITAMQGELVPTFGDDGTLRLTDTAVDTALIQLWLRDDGSLVTRSSEPPIIGTIAPKDPFGQIARFGPNGMLDPSWNSGVPRDITTGGRAELDADGSILYVRGGELTKFTPNGALDASFGAGGVGHPGFPASAATIDVKEVHSGGWLVSGSGNVGEDDFVARVLPNGALDPTFGTAGIIRVASHRSIMVDPSGAFYLNTAYGDVQAFSASGALRTSFGVGGTLTGLGLSRRFLDSAGELTDLQSTNHQELQIRKYSGVSGQPIASYGVGGVAVVPLPLMAATGVGLVAVRNGIAYVAYSSQTASLVTAVDIASAAVVPSFGGSDGDGNAVLPAGGPAPNYLANPGLAASSAGLAIAYGNTIARLTLTGILVSTFGDGGSVVLGRHNRDVVTDMAREADGGTLVAFRDRYQLRVARVGADGGPVAPATSLVICSPNARPDVAFGRLLPLPDGRFGVAYWDVFGGYAVAVYLHDGSPDLTFGTNGVAKTPSADVRAGGSSGAPVIIASEFVRNGAASTISFTKIDAHSGAVDTSYGSGGTKTISGPEAMDSTRFVVDGAGRVVWGWRIPYSGYTPPLRDFAKVLRLTSTGLVDTSFGIAGQRTVQAPADQVGASIRISMTGSSIVMVASTGGSSVVVAKLDANGNLVSSYGTAGVSTVRIGTVYPPGYDGSFVDSSQVLVVMRSTTTGFVVLRLDQNGQVDEHVGPGGMVDLPQPMGYNPLFIVSSGGAALVAATIDSVPRSGELIGSDGALMKVSLDGPAVVHSVAGAALATKQAVRLSLP